ncbi:polysaccharide deacetylase family protein [Candidatus Altiarchaeota archaeon]
MFALRVDIDSLEGLRQGVPKILDVLRDLGIKASFYCLMGWEGDLWSTINHRLLREYENPLSKTEEYDESDLIFKSPLNISKIFRCLLSPKSLSSEKAIIERILSEGHSLGVHGYVHVRWRGITPSEINKEFKYMMSAYSKIIGEQPKGFSAPLNFTSEHLLRTLNDYGFLCNSYLGGKTIYRPTIDGQPSNFVMVPVIIHQSGIPIIEYLYNKGLNSDNIIKRVSHTIEDAEKNFGLSSLYIHPKVEGDVAINIFQQLMSYISEEGHEIKNFEDIALDYLKNEDCHTSKSG